MKHLLFLLALAAGASAQDTTPADKPTDGTAPVPAVVKPATGKTDFTPGKADPAVAPTGLQPSAPDLPTLPQTATGAKNAATLQRFRNDDIAPLLPDKVPDNLKRPLIGTTAERPRLRTSLLPPMTPLDMELRVRYRQAETKAQSDPTVQAAWQASRVAATDFAKRAAMKDYYDRLYKKMLSYDKGIAPIVEDRERYNLRRMIQSRIAPTEGLKDVDGVDNRGGGGLSN